MSDPKGPESKEGGPIDPRLVRKLADILKDTVPRGWPVVKDWNWRLSLQVRTT